MKCIKKFMLVSYISWDTAVKAHDSQLNFCCNRDKTFLTGRCRQDSNHFQLLYGGKQLVGCSVFPEGKEKSLVWKDLWKKSQHGKSGGLWKCFCCLTVICGTSCRNIVIGMLRDEEKPKLFLPLCNLICLITYKMQDESKTKQVFHFH